MTKSMRGAMWAPAVAMAALMAWGCGESSDEPPPTVPGARGPGPGADAGGGSPLRQAMIKIGRGPQALTGAIGKALESDSPSWEAVQVQTGEYLRLAQSLPGQEPRKGGKESWAKYSAEFTELAKSLDDAARSMDLPAARIAHDQVEGSCMGCHREHRMMGRGPGGPGGFGGPPPGGPGGPPSP